MFEPLRNKGLNVRNLELPPGLICSSFSGGITE